MDSIFILVKHFKKISQRACISDDARFHDLRHSFAVSSLYAGDDIKTVHPKGYRFASTFWVVEIDADNRMRLRAVDLLSQEYLCEYILEGPADRSYTPEKQKARAEALEAATLYATEVPLKTMKAASEVFPIVRAMAQEGNPNSVSDAGVGALAARSAVLGAELNVKINAAGLADRETAARLCAEAFEIASAAVAAEAEVLAIVNSKIQ